jgi:hypothetical protein
MGDAGNFAKGMADSISMYLGLQTQQHIAQQQATQKNQLEMQQNVQKTQLDLTNPPRSSRSWHGNEHEP